jgi:hypothetical protein
MTEYLLQIDRTVLQARVPLLRPVVSAPLCTLAAHAGEHTGCVPGVSGITGIICNGRDSVAYVCADK